MMYKIYIVVALMFSSAFSLELSNKPIPSRVEHIKYMAIESMMLSVTQGKNKDAIVKQQKKYPAPLELSKIFVKAYLSSDEETLEKIAPKEMIDTLKSIDKRVKKIFEHIEKYDTHSMMLVEGKMLPLIEKDKLHEKTIYLSIKGEQKQMKFGFVWLDERWILLEVL